ncbi:MerR family DNA-binding protein [Polaromonas sp.]|uniref:MerR family DNA-binding protein n=1 Tax=Polaromonas sp. TaxID=1869339 RepID=UPI00345548B0
MNHMNIGEAAAAAGVTPKMIRHYESLGLIPEAERTASGYRLYGVREVGMLRFIRQSRVLGFSIKQIEALLAFWRDGGRESREVKELALQQLAELEQRQRELDQMKATLSELIHKCAGDHQSRCAILERLSAAEGVSDAEAPTAPGPIKTLKHVRAGSRREKCHHESPKAENSPAHAGLVAWSRTLAPSALV